jgi:succinate dehydrogenase / fumarate reductase cytochrome b subunit
MMHMLGNMLIFVGAKAYNSYSHALISNPLIYVVEALLVFLLLVHVFIALGLKLRNMRSKPTKYAVSPIREKSTSLSSRTMAYTGMAVLAFIIWHLITFKFGNEYSAFYDGVRMRDLYALVFEKFSSPTYVVLYSICMVLIGFHLWHGVKSIFQTLGIHHPRYQCAIKCFAYSYAVIVAIGFLSQPIYVYFVG